MNENALELTDEQALAALAALSLRPEGMEHILPEDVAQPARLKIQQKEGDGRAAGVLYNSLSGKVYGPAVEIIFLRWESDTAVMWPVKYNKDNDPLCYSNDGIYPAEQSERRPMTNPQRGPCTGCPAAQFGTDGESPRCKRQRNCLVWIMEDKEPARLTLQSTGLKPGKILTNLSVSCNVSKSIWVTSAYQDTDQGQWYLCLFTAGEAQPPRVALEFHRLAKTITFDILADTTGDANGYTPDPDADIIDGDAEETPF